MLLVPCKWERALFCLKAAKWAVITLVSLVAPRALELVGAGVCAVAARRYGNAEGSLKEDLAKRAVEAGDAVRKIMVK